MESPALYDLSPLLRLLLLGLALALGPLAWVGLRHSQATPARRLYALTLLTLFLTFDLVLFGAFTRLSDSGLGCPDWPGCYGHASPLGAADPISAAHAAQPSGPVSHSKAWIEMLHRYFATGVGVLITTILAASWLERRRQTRLAAADPAHNKLAISLVWPAFTLFWVCLQGAFGALTVTMKLFPAIVTLHLLGGMGLLLLLCAQAARWQQADGAQRQPLPPGLRLGLWLVLVLVLIQMALGGWVSTNYAVLACAEFPTCQGQWWPAMDWAQGFEIWRELGLTSQGQPISFAALTAIHYLHRLMAYAVLAALALLVWRLWRAKHMKAQTRLIAALALWQLATGLANVLLGWPLLAALAHTGGAAGLLLALSWALCASRNQSEQDGVQHVANPHPSPLPRAGEGAGESSATTLRFSPNGLTP